MWDKMCILQPLFGVMEHFVFWQIVVTLIIIILMQEQLFLPETVLLPLSAYHPKKVWKSLMYLCLKFLKSPLLWEMVVLVGAVLSYVMLMQLVLKL